MLFPVLLGATVAVHGLDPGAPAVPASLLGAVFRVTDTEQVTVLRCEGR